MQLYDYQQRLVDDVYGAWGRCNDVLKVLGTGGGKTVTFSKIVHDHTGAAAITAHRREIITQISLALAALDTPHRIIAPPATVRRIRQRHLRKCGMSYIDPGSDTGVASVQTMTSAASGRDARLQAWLSRVSLSVYDEGHHYVRSGVWAKAVDRFPDARRLFVTATPERADGKGLGAHADGYAQEMVLGPSESWLIANKRKAPYRYFAPESDLDVSGLVVTASGDFNAKALRQRNVASHIVGDAVREYQKLLDGKRAILFASDVETAAEFAQSFNAAGIPAAMLHGGTDAGERDYALDRFESGELLVLVNVDLFDEGFDVPACDAAILTRPTESLAKFLQMVGRAQRYVEGKTAIIVDMVRNWERHGMPDWPRQWTLDARDRRARGGASDTIPQKVCTTCTQPYEAFYVACPHCGAVPDVPERRRPEQVDGDLHELDADAMAQLFARMEMADLSDDDYKLDQVIRNIPPVGRASDLKRHQRDRYRRDVLRDIVGRWVAYQPEGRSMSEIHRRFYHRFGVDIGTAFTLRANETDALVARICQHFTKDISP